MMAMVVESKKDPVSLVDELFVTDYSDKSIIVTGNTIPHSNNLKKLGGNYNPMLKTGGGWIFAKYREDTVLDYIKTGNVAPLISKNYKQEILKKTDLAVLIFKDLKNAFEVDEEYRGDIILAVLNEYEQKYVGGSGK